ncbi:TOMM system kinase/cyclase fusion protein [Sorangium sp. So ce295]|uniref:TOMM system kinase/cyclase fusion protein n=1 Tax=Sorangium sp. So ce295 TaxID=3133295 RepID=UPI003F5F488A
MDSRQKIGAVLGDRYEILAELGEGGFSTVYKARQLATGQCVAIKVLQLGSSGAAQAREKRVARFKREMQLCGQLHHPNIVSLIDSGQADEDVVYSVFQFAPGKDLARVLAEEGPLDPREARHFMLQILDALGCAHAQGVIHRDLKPANLMVIPTGARRNVLVLDFGIGALTEEASREEKTRLTLTNESVGTPAYAAPEQLRGQPPTPRTDLYAWGLVFLECLTGKRVIAGDTAADVIFNQLSADPVAIPATIVDHPLGDILRRATAKDAAARNVTTEGLLRELEECDVSGLRSRSAPVRLQRVAPDMLTETVELARQLADGGRSKQLVEGERRQITAVCCTLAASSTAQGQVDTEELDQLLGLQQEACTMIARRFHGHVAGVLGDSVLFYFGYPTAREDAARRAAESAREMAADLRRRREAVEAERKIRIDLRIGIHTGLVIARELRDLKVAGLGYVVGTTPNLAAQLSAAAEPGGIVVSGETQRLLRKHFALEEDGSRSLDGSEAPVEVFHLRDGSVPGGLRDVPLVGRARELDTLLERWGHVRSGGGQAVLITGEPGIGKSRLARELEERIDAEAHSWLESRCTPDSANSAFYPIVSLLERLIDPRREAKPEDRADKLEALLSLHGFDLSEAMPLFASLLSLTLPGMWAPLDASPQKQRELTRNAVLSLLFEMAEREPVALFIEDLHWADPSTLELLGQLVGEVGSSRVLALFTARPEFAPSWSPAAVLQIQLGRLGRPEVEQMAMKVIGGRALPAEVLDVVAGRTDGVPLFVEELVLAMIEAGALVEVKNEERYALVKPLSELAIPATLRDSLMARLDRLGRAKETAQIAAAIGREFTFELLQAVSPLGEAEAQEDLDRLLAAELVYRKRRLKSAAYTFKHGLIRDAAYDSMLKRSRQQVHARIAKALEETLPEVVEARPELLAHHLAEGDLEERAVDQWRKAGHLANQRSAHVEAAAHLSRGLALLESLAHMPARERIEIDMQLAHGAALIAVRGYTDPVVERAYARAQALCERADNSPEVFWALVGLHLHHHVMSNLREAVRLSELLQRIAEVSGEPALLAVSQFELGSQNFFLGDFRSALSQLDQAFALCPPDERLYLSVTGGDLRVVALCFGALVLWHRGRTEDALARGEEALALARELRHAHTLTCALIFIGAELFFYTGDRVSMRRYIQDAIALCDKHCFPYWRVEAEFFLAWAAGDAALEGTALDDLRRKVDEHAGVAHTLFLGIVGDMLLAKGRFDDARQVARRGLEIAEKSLVRLWSAELMRIQGEATLGAGGGVDEAEAYLRAAFDLARAQGSVALELRALHSLCRFWRAHGRAGHARELAAARSADIADGLETAEAKSARAELASLARGV